MNLTGAISPPLVLLQAGIVSVTGFVSGPVVSAVIGGVFLLINSFVTIYVTRVLERKEIESRRAEDKTESDSVREGTDNPRARDR